MKIDYVIIASDENPMYKDFYPIVAKKWFDLGFKTYYVNICDDDEIFENKWGIIHKIKSLDFIPTSLQSQVVRLFVSNFIEANILTSDIDMLPLNKDYFIDNSNELTDDNIIVYTGQPYNDSPNFPMCYILSHSKTLSKVLEIENMNFSDYCKILYEKYGNSWNTDENFMYDQFKKNLDKLIIKKRKFINGIAENRIDRVNWNYNKELIKNGYFVDSHLLRPYNQYFKEINKLINDVK